MMQFKKKKKSETKMIPKLQSMWWNIIRSVSFLLHFVFLLQVVSSMTIDPKLSSSRSSVSTSQTMNTNQQQQQHPFDATTAGAARSLNLYRQTPLLKSDRLSLEWGDRDIYFKLDSTQLSGSFKDRGMAYLCYKLQTERGTKKLISSSGGNAGLAAATVGQSLQMQVQVIVPTTTKPFVVEKLKQLGATVQIHGMNWNAADLLARELVEKDPTASYIPPYDHPDLWTGHSTVVDEIYEDLHPIYPASIVVSVGGGGLLCGIFEGLQRQMSATDTTNIPVVVAAETTGAASFHASYETGILTRLDSIASIATSLGALEVTPVTLERAAQHIHNAGDNPNVVQSIVCTDADAVDACAQFYRDHNILVEPACGAALAIVYNKGIRERLQQYLKEGPIVVEVCGGSGISKELLEQWEEEYL